LQPYWSIEMRPGESLTLARIWYALIGGGALILTASEIKTDFDPGSVVDLPNLAAGLAVGMLAIGAAVWVLTASPVRAAVAWLGIAAGVAPFAWLFWIAATTARDAIWLAAVPTVLALAAAVRMALARLAAKAD
jgi:hypothetical protein